MARPGEDRYTNYASASVTESAVGTKTFTELVTGISLGQGIGMLIDEIDYQWSSATIEDIVAVGDRVAVGWFTSNADPGFTLDDRRLIHIHELFPEPIIGTPASGGSLISMPRIYQFFPPLIVAAPRLFLGVVSNSLNAVAIVQSRFMFRYINLTDKEYLELAETFILVG